MIQRYNEKLSVCSYCLQPGHSAFKCGKKPRKTLNTYSGLTVSSSFGGQRKPMNKVGKQGKKTANYVAQWKLTQKPNHQGFYTCYISGRQVPYLCAEHPYSKVRHPELRTNQDLEPVSVEINKLKGSMDIADFLLKYPEYRTTVNPKYLALLD